MSKMRRLAKILISLDFLFVIGWEVIACVIGIIGVAVAVFNGDSDSALNTAGRVLAGIGLLGFIWWVAQDARKAADRLRRDSKSESDSEDSCQQDMSDVAGIHKRPPWMG